MTTLAVRSDQDYWDENQIATLAQGGIDRDVTRAELRSFLHLCQRTQLDPFARQIYLIGRYNSQANRKVYTPQTGIDGYRVVAQRTCAAMREQLGYEDTVWCGPDGVWVDVWLKTEPPSATKVTVLRNGQRFPAVALWDEYKQLNKQGQPAGLWAKMPAGQLAKCAEALALRKAFPNDLAGVYTAEEMAQADNPTHPAPVDVTRLTVVPDAPSLGATLDKLPDGDVFEAELVEDPRTGAGGAPPEVAEPPAPATRGLASKKQQGFIAGLFENCGWTDKADMLRATCKIVGREVGSAAELKANEASDLITVLQSCASDAEPSQALTQALTQAVAS